jgi:hypothetical protein
VVTGLLSDDARAIVEAARDVEGPTSDDKARIRRALAIGLGGAAAAASTATAASTAAASSVHTLANVATAVPASGLAATTSMASVAGSAAASSAAASSAAASSAAASTAVAGWSLGLGKALVAISVVGAVAGTAVVVDPPWDDASSTATSSARRTDRSVPKPILADRASGERATSTAGHADDLSAPPLLLPSGFRSEPVPPPSAPSLETTGLAARRATPRTPPVSLPEVVAINPVSPEVPAAEAPSLSVQVTSLRAAYAARQRGELARALELLDTHERDYPDSVLEPERRATRVLVLCDLGRAVEARTVRDAFLARHGGSPLATRLAGSCVSD